MMEHEETAYLSDNSRQSCVFLRVSECMSEILCKNFMFLHVFAAKPVGQIVMNDSDNTSQRQEIWHDDDHEYYTRLHAMLVRAGMENYPIFLGMVNWTVSPSSYGRGRFSVRFVPASVTGQGWNEDKTLGSAGAGLGREAFERKFSS
jgi:hypothetical protein